MDVLNTYGGEIVTALAWYGYVGIALIFLGMIITYASADNESLGGLLFGLALIVTLLIVAYNGGFTHETGELTPINHEVTLRPGGVIDAVKYDIIEQRGAIYVIEEREAIAE